MQENKSYIWIVVVLILLLLAGGGYFYFKIVNSKKNVTSQSTPSVTLSATLATSSSPTATPSASPSPSSTGCVISAEEKSQTADWKTYSGSTFSFKYPSAWTITESKDIVTVKGEDSGKRIEFSVRTNEMSNLGFENLTLTDTSQVKVGCVDSTQVTLSGENDLTLITNSFTEKDTKYLISFSYYNIGASYSGSIVKINSLILKTFEFK